MNKDVVFLDTCGTSRGGLSVGIGVKSKETFLQSVEEINEELKDKPYQTYPSYRYAVIDKQESKIFKKMTVEEFGEIFTDDDINRMGELLEYKSTGNGASRYPIFLKSVYLKYGYEKKGQG